MNPLLLLLGLLGLSAASSGSSSQSNTANANINGRGKKPVTDKDDPDQGNGMQTGSNGKSKKPVTETDDPDQGSGMQTGSDDTTDTGGDTSGDMDMGGDTSGDMDMGGDTSGDTDTGGDTSGETDPHAGHNHGGDTSGDMDMGGDTSGDTDMGGDTSGDTDTGGDTSGETDPHAGHNHGGDTSGDTDMGGDTSGDMDMGGDTSGDMDTGGDTSGDMDMGGDTSGDMDMGGDTSGDTDTGGDTSGDMDMGGDTSGDGHNHVDMGTPDIPPPGIGASQSEISSYINALSSASEAHIHDATSSKTGEHEALLDLVPRGDATHVAIGDGDWDDPSIWSNGEVPGDDARVLIPDGVSVDYSTVSDARLFTVRVDGALDFATNADSQMIFDTFVVSPTGHLIMGTEANPVSADVNIDLIVADNGQIDTNWDPMLLSRGLISHGDITVHGAEKDSHDKVDDDPMAGDNSVSFASVPEGWQLGDTIVVAGTHYDGYTWNNEIRGQDFFPPEDEVRVITDIIGGEVFFDDPLIYDHDTPRDDLSTSVANYTRNVSIESEAGADAEVFERGHVMLMHSDNVDVRFMEFTELGRTDKSEEAFSVDDIDNITFDSNVQGRYSLHLHRTGLDDPENPTILEGNAVYGSPGWGVVHHDSNAIIDNNATYDTFGAGYVAETGNEIGIWSDNIAIFAQGVDWGIPKNTSITHGNFDTARGGEGFWFQGRMVASVDNVAASVNTGFSFFHRGEGMLDFDSSLFELSDALYNADTVTPDDVPIMVFEGNETFAAREGLHVVKANTAQGHDVWSRLEDFTAWSVINGVELEYTSHYILSEFDLIAREPDTFSQPQDGITFGNNLTEIIVIDSRIEGFENGIDLNKNLLHNDNSQLHDYFVINTDIVNVDNDFINRDSRDTILDNAPTRDYNVEVDITLGLSEFGGVSITGSKTDGLGSTDFPGGMDEFTIDRNQLVEILDTTGYWSTSGGQEYTLVDIYFTDRLTGDIYYESTPVYLDNYPVGDVRANAGLWADNVFNGVQNVGNFDPVVVPAPTIETMSPSIDALDASVSSMNGMVQSTTTYSAVSETAFASDIWMDGYDGDNTLSLGVDDGTFTNTGDMTNVDLVAMGGETVLASDGGEFELGASRTLAVFEAAAQVGFDGEDGGTAILDMQEGSTVAFAANDGDLGTIEEFDSSAFEGPTNVLSGIDLGNATLSIDLAGLSAEAGSAFTLMSADEIVGIFNEAVIGGLGARDARIVVDYENDSVSLELAAGDGAVTVDALGAETDVTSGEEALWDALTAGQSVLSDTSPMADEEDLLLDEVA